MDLTFAAPVLYMVSGCPTGHEELLRNLLLLVAVLAAAAVGTKSDLMVKGPPVVLGKLMFLGQLSN